MTKQAFHTQEANLRKSINQTDHNTAQLISTHTLHIKFKEMFHQYSVTINQVKAKRNGNDCQQGHISFFLYFLQSMGK